MSVKPYLDSLQMIESKNTSCALCGDSSTSAKSAVEEYSLQVPGMALCWSCAESAANTFWKKHSGEWLTWPNEEKATAYSATKKSIPQSLRTKVFERDMYRCLRCGSHQDLSADHIVPESEGGPTSEENLQTLCRPCNSWKATQTINFRGKA